MTKAATPCFTPRIPSASLFTIRLYTQIVGLRASDLDTIMHGVAEAGSVCACQWLRREHAAYVVTQLLALDAWLNQNIKKRTRNVSCGQTRGSVCVGSDLSERNMMKLGIGFTQEKAEVSSPLLVYIDLLALLYILHA